MGIHFFGFFQGSKKISKLTNLSAFSRKCQILKGFFVSLAKWFSPMLRLEERKLERAKCNLGFSKTRKFQNSTTTWTKTNSSQNPALNPKKKTT